MKLLGRISDRSKISIAEALKLVNVSKTTLYRDLKENKLSSTTDTKRKKVIDTAELERFYGQLKSLSVNRAGNNGNSQTRLQTFYTGRLAPFVERFRMPSAMKRETLCDIRRVGVNLLQAPML